MASRKKGIKITLLVLAALIALVTADHVYVTEYKLTDKGTEFSPDGQYSVSFQMVGTTDWPFGPTTAKVTVRKTDGNKRIKTFKTDIYDDGVSLSEYHWDVSRSNDSVTIVLKGSEQEDELYIVPLQ